MKKLIPREIKIKNKPWLNEEIAKLIKLINKAHARKKRQCELQEVLQLVKE